MDLPYNEVLKWVKIQYPEIIKAADFSCFDASSLGSDLEDISNKFSRCQKLWNSSSPVFLQWKKKRIKVTEALEDIACELDAHKKNCNIARLTAGSVGAVGGMLSVAGIILAPFTLGASTSLIIAGTVTALSGGSVSVGTAITETGLVRKKVKDFHALMAEHEKDSKCLDEWVKGTSELVAAVNEIVDVNIFEEIIQAMSTLTGGVMSQDKIETNMLKIFISCLIENILLKPLLPAAATSAVTFILFTLKVPKLFLLMFEVAKLHDSDPLVFEAIMLSSKVVLQIFRSVDMGVDTVTTIISASRVTSAAVANTLAKAVTHGVLAGVGVALDITSIILTSKSVHGGSKSRHAKKIREAKEQLKKGLERFSELSDGLCSLNDLK